MIMEAPGKETNFAGLLNILGYLRLSANLPIVTSR